MHPEAKDRLSERLAIWQGVYASFEEALPHATGPGFDGDVWRTRSLAGARECVAALGAGRSIPELHKQRSTLLPPVVALMLGPRERVRIVDFGGGLGIGYLTLVESIPRAEGRIEYTIVERPGICEEGRTLFPAQPRFVETLPADERFDLAHAASALQYVADWRGLLKSLAACEAELMLLSDVFAGDIPSFVTLQNYYGSRIRHWFLDLDELLAVSAGLGYRLAMKTFATARRLGVEDVLPMDDFPPSHRLERSLHLLLRREP